MVMDLIIDVHTLRCTFSFYLTEDNRPNIVFVLTDDQGSHDVGYQGSLIKTPNLDHLASQGIRLDNYYTHPICTPSRIAILTGRHVVSARV